MNADGISALIFNAALLLILIMVYDFATVRISTPHKPFRQVVNGIILGCIGMGIMLTPMQLEPGIIFDTRSVLLGISGLFLGPIPTIIAMAMTGTLRLIQGGTAMYMGVSVILTSGFIGITWGAWRKGRLEDIGWGELYLLGIVIHLIMLGCTFVMPMAAATRVFNSISIPVILLYPTATSVLGKILANRLKRELTARELEESEDRYRSMFQNNHAVMLIIDPDSLCVVDANPAASMFYGWSRNELISMSICDINTANPEALRLEIDKAQHQGINHFLFQHRLADGSIRDVESFSGPIFISGRRLLFSIIHDVTERKKAQETLRSAMLQLNMAQEVAQVGSWIWHVDEGRMEWSDQMYKIFGIEKGDFESIFDGSMKDTIHPDDLQALFASNAAMVRNKLPESMEFRINRSDGTQHTLWLQAGEMSYDENGEIISLSGIVQDITERKRVEEEIRRLNAELEQRVRDRTTELEATNQQLEAFSYSVSHDLRAPLRAINGFANILAETQEGKLSAEGQHALDVINSEALRMGKLIDDLLLFSRFGRQALRKVEFDHGAVVRDIFAELMEQHPNYNVELIMTTLPTAPADPGLLRQVWFNLMQNALKFSRRREHAVITVSGSYQKNEAVYHIRDNGAGFDMQYADKLFGVFQRLHRVDEFEGTGVGLALVQRVILRHGGHVWAEGAVDVGATFSFSLPVAMHEDNEGD